MPKSARKSTKRKAAVERHEPTEKTSTKRKASEMRSEPGKKESQDETAAKNLPSSDEGKIERKFTAEEAGTRSLSPIYSVCDDMSLHVSHANKEKIWKGEYIDLAILLPRKNVSHDNQNQIIKVINGELVLKPKEAPMKIETIETWTDAFFIFMNIFLCKHPEAAQDMLHYMNTVRQGSRRALDWKKYDEQYRLRKMKNPSSSWSSVDGELWLLQSSPSIFSSQSFAKGKVFA